MSFEEESKKMIQDAVNSTVVELIEYRVNILGDCLQIVAYEKPIGARILRCTGGPDIWIDTHLCVVIGKWAGKTAIASFSRAIADEINDFLGM